jgi:uncharacterized membrane protein
MELARCARHLLQTRRAMRRRFSDAVLTRVESAVRAAETTHSGEIRVAIESDLDLADLWHDMSPRQRAVEVFSQLGVWDTARSNGVLIYVLLADRDVEIVADRGLNGLVHSSQWETVCRAMESEFAHSRWEQGLLTGIDAASRLLAAHFPAGDGDRDELPNRPTLL